MRKNYAYLYVFTAFILISFMFCTLGISLSSMKVEEASLNGDESRPVIVIDAGHGGEDGGACTYGEVAEKELNLLIAQDLRDMLRFCGIDVIMTRDEDILLYDKNSDYQGKKKSQDLAKRLEIASSTENAILISIHMNAFPETKYKGLQVYFSPHTESSYTLANSIQNNTRIKLMPDNNRKVKKADSRIYLLDRFKGTGVLIECGFLSNPEEYEKLCTEKYRSQLAVVLMSSINDYVKNGGV